MNAQTDENTNYLDDEELVTFKEKTNQLMADLQNGDFESALRQINEINQMNDENLFRIIGKITRGLHDAISELKHSSDNEEEEKNRTQTGLSYVIDVTADAAKTTLDMTEQSRDALVSISDNMDKQDKLLEKLSKSVKDEALKGVISEFTSLMDSNKESVAKINSNVMEITIAQNYQDLASQSIQKSIKNIRSVEVSLIALTKHTNLLKQISQFTSNPEKLNEVETEELCQNLEKLDLQKPESEHMDQDDVDDLLSSLGF